MIDENADGNMQENSLIKRVRIIGVVEETADAKTFLLQPLDGWAPTWAPGQFMTLVFDTPQGEKRRSYSFSSALKEDMAITVKRVANGQFSRYMLNHFAVGDVLRTSGIGGMFNLPDTVASDTHFCFLAAGSGIVPCFAMIRTLLHRYTNRMTLIYSNKSRADTIFYSRLESMRAEYGGRFEVLYLNSDSNDIYRRRMSKWLLEQLLDQYFAPALNNTRFYLCGPFEYMRTIEITLRSKAPGASIIKENFDTMPRGVLPEPPDKLPRNVGITIAGRNYELEVQYPASVLKAAKMQGIELPYSCEAGRCSSCVATCTRGTLWMAYNEVLTDSEVRKGRVLVCQAFPVGGDVQISYDL